MQPPYYPIPSALFLVPVAVVLTLLMAAAAYIDATTGRVPKRLTLSTFAAGVVVQLVGGAWMAAENRPGWLFADGVVLGLLDGLLFAFAGAATGLAVFVALWILGIAGGGDVKLATGLGAWLGPRLLIGAVIFSAPAIAILAIVAVVRATTKGRQARPAGRILTFSLPLAVGTLLLFLVMFRIPLGLTDK